MRIVYITERAPHGPGETFVFAEVLALRDKGHTVAILPLHQGPGPVGARATQVASTSIGPARGTALRGIGEALANPLQSLKALASILTGLPGLAITLRNLRALWKALSLLRELRAFCPDHLHGYWATEPATFALVASLFLGVPWSFTAHRWDIVENSLLGEKVRRASFTRAISERGRRALEAASSPPSPSRIAVVHVGVAVGPVPPPPARSSLPHRLCCIADLVPIKGHLILLQAVRDLLARGVGVELHLYGDGPAAEALRAFCHDSQLEQAVVFHGRATHDEILSILRSGLFELSVLPSIQMGEAVCEGIPVSLVESMAAGVPVVSTDSGGIPELVGPEEGLLVEHSNPGALAAAISQAIQHPELRARLAANAYRKVKSAFDATQTAAQLCQLFQESRGQVRSWLEYR